jgi:radical SAM modification target selenobiotic family peptide
MVKKDVQKLLASLGVAGLITAGGVSTPGVQAASGSG